VRRHTVARVRYFTAKVNARPNKPHDPVHQDVYLRALATRPTVSIHLGHFLANPVKLPLANPAGCCTTDQRCCERPAGSLPIDSEVCRSTGGH
jgi:hypothetical protein